MRGLSGFTVFDSARRGFVDLANRDLRLHVCGITPYKSTHLGHAFTYIAFDTLFRLAAESGIKVVYIQNISDIDDPLFEYASELGMDYRELAKSQTRLFFEDMNALGCIPPDFVIPVSKILGGMAQGIRKLLECDMAYRLPNGDVYFDSSSINPGEMFHLDRDAAMSMMLATDAGRSAFDPLLWREVVKGKAKTHNTKRDLTKNRATESRSDEISTPGATNPGGFSIKESSEEGDSVDTDNLGNSNAGPHWNTAIGIGRPAWHIACATIANLDIRINRAEENSASQNNEPRMVHIHGGGRDLAFPHHEFTHVISRSIRAVNAKNTAEQHIFMHAGIVSYMGHKMSKSRGNLVFISHLREECKKNGLPPSVIRLALLQKHYREDWEWNDSYLQEAIKRLQLWKKALQGTLQGDCEADEETERFGDPVKSAKTELTNIESIKTGPGCVESANTGFQANINNPSGDQESLGNWKIHEDVFEKEFNHRQPIHFPSPKRENNDSIKESDLREELLNHLYNDLDTPSALKVVDCFAKKGKITIPEAQAIQRLLGVPLDYA